MFNPDDLSDMSDEALLLALEETDSSEHIPILGEQRKRAYESEEFGEAASLSFRMGEIAKANGDRKSLAKAKHYEGSALFDAEEYLESALRYEEAAQIYKELGLQKNATNTLYWRANALLQLDDEEQSVKASDEAISFARQENDYTLLGRSLYIKGQGLFYLKKYEEALTELLEAVENLGLSGNSDDVARVYEFIGRTLYQLNRNRESIDYLQKASIIIQNGIDDELKLTIPELKRKISFNYYQLREHDKCVKLLEEAKKELQSQGKVEEVAHCEFDIGDSLQELDRDEESLDFFLRAETLAESVGNKKLANKALHYRGLSQQNLGRYDDALELYSRLWNQTNTKPDLRELANTAYMRILSALIYLERYQEVIERYEKAPKWDDYKTPPNDETVMKSHYCRALFESGNHDAALRIASEGIAKSPSDSWGVARATFFEIRSKLTRKSHVEKSEQDLSFAISLLLASNWVDRARDLSEYYITKAGEITKEKSIESDAE